MAAIDGRCDRRLAPVLRSHDESDVDREYESRGSVELRAVMPGEKLFAAMLPRQVMIADEDDDCGRSAGSADGLWNGWFVEVASRG
ncbi:hypothetical protein [Bifidobacterium sp. SO1]|uniref:hypothetical protein n=1 Tax=Bifidobacterium sp. SO1 TaxID=2809029 RepID=UPI001BDC54D4|nr:hypothetical protein [Bifidobacterium sp. SO1]MBT1160527.1 hypothetical protein [Bifidobacterium sp. SO1]